MKRYVLNSLLLLIIMLAVSCSDNQLMDSDENIVNNEEMLTSDYFENEKMSLILGENLLNSFSTTMTRSFEKEDYPDFYGGAFVDEKGQFVILVPSEELA